jgi:CDP-glucose 4,6-dehydratase
MTVPQSPLPQNSPLESLHGRTVFVTGHTGFKGSWLTIWLRHLGANVVGYGLPPLQEQGIFQVAEVTSLLSTDHRADIRDYAALSQAIHHAQPDVIFHLAAQPLVRESYAIPRETHEVNYMGTCNVLEAVRTMQRPCAVVIVTTDKCYENKEQVWGYREIDRLGGHDPYSASKAAAELLAASYRESFFPSARLHEHGVGIATARAGNVIGGGDWAKDRIVPDMVRSLVTRNPVRIRSPQSVRPWQHVLEPLHGYLRIATRLLEMTDPAAASAWNFGPGVDGHRTVGALVGLFHELWGDGVWKPDHLNHPHETTFLSLAIDKAVNHLDWSPAWDFRTTVTNTVRWYRAQVAGDTMLTRCHDDIEAFSAAIRGCQARTASLPRAMQQAA